jgi:hypothetical protein
LSEVSAASVNLFGLTNVWRYEQTTNFDGVSWMAPAFDDSAWPSGPGLLYVEDHPAVMPKSTPLTLGRMTYYFRTHFLLPFAPQDVTLTFSNLIDDGAVFYLNGAEIQRVRMPVPPTVISNATAASSVLEATNFDVFTISGPR